MKRILINATHAEEIRVALCNGNHLYDFDLENRTREQKKANIYKGHVTRVEPSLEAVFVEYGSARQGFLPIREIASDYLSGDPRSGNIKNLIKEGDELIVQIEKEERGNKGAALSTFVSLAGRYLVLMPNNPRGGGISRQISGKLRDEMKQILSDLRLPKGMSVIIRTAGIGKSSEDLQQDLDHLLTIWKGIQEQNKKYPSPRLVHQEAGVVTRAVRDYLRDDIAEIWVDNENAYNEAANFIEAVMPQQASKLRKYTDFEPMFARFGIEKQIETAYQREVRLPSGGSIVIDQTEALVSIDINSSKATKGADVSETAYNTNLEAADEIARQLRLRDMGGLIVIDFIDMATSEHQKQVENRLRDATKNDRARIQFAEISRFGLLEMSRQRLRPSLEEATGFLCPRCHGNGMIRDLRSLALSIMRQIEQKALLERQGEVQAEVPTEIAAFLLNEKRESLVYLEQDSGVRITILPHAHLESPNFTLTYNREGFAPTSYERISESEQSEIKDRGYDTNWHTEQEVLDSQIRQTSQLNQNNSQKPSSAWSNANAANTSAETTSQKAPTQNQAKPQTVQPSQAAPQPSAVAWLSNLFAPTQQATLADAISSQAAAAAIEDIVNAGGKSLGVYGQVSAIPAPSPVFQSTIENDKERQPKRNDHKDNRSSKARKDKYENSAKVPDDSKSTKIEPKTEKIEQKSSEKNEQKTSLPKREPHSKRDSRGEKERKTTLTPPMFAPQSQNANEIDTPTLAKTDSIKRAVSVQHHEKPHDPNQIQVTVHKLNPEPISVATTHLSLDDHKSGVSTQKQEIKGSNVVPPSIMTPAKQIQATPVSHTTTRSSSIDKSSPTSILNSPPTGLISEIQLPIMPEEKPVVKQLNVMPINGRASNDPREVYKQFIQNTAIPMHTTIAANIPQPNVATNLTSAIVGTAGQFVQAHLPQPPKEGVSFVSNFLEAMKLFHSNNPVSTDKSNNLQTVATDTSTTTHFSSNFQQYFQNYGFATLTESQKQLQHNLIVPEKTYYCESGTTNALPVIPTQRASNDPRGKLVNSVVASSQPEVAIVNSPIEVASPTTQPVELVPAIAESSVAPSTTMLTYLPDSVGEWIEQHLGQAGHEMIANGQLVNAYLQAHKLRASLQKASTDELTTTDVHGLVSEDEVNKIADLADTWLQDIANPAFNAMDTLLNPEEDNSTKSKTTASSYKNMIESVAEQMSKNPATILNLASPKARGRKPKTPDKVAIKAPSKAKTRTSKKLESAIVTKVVKKSANPISGEEE